MDGLSDAASLITLLQLASSVIKYFKNVSNAPIQKRKLLSALVQARGLLSTLIDLTNDVDDEDWSHTIQSLSTPNGPLSAFQDILEQIARKIGVTTSDSNISSAIGRLRWPFDQSQVQEMLASLEKLKSCFLLAIANDHIRISMIIRDELQEVRSQLTTMFIDTRRQTTISLSKEQKLIVDSLSLVNLSGELDGERVIEMRASTEWLLLHENFKRWHDSSTTPSTLVLTGNPGSGKSSACQVTRFFLKAWHQSEIDICIAYLAFNSLQGEDLTKSMALSNIVQQILLDRPYLMDHVTALKVTGGPLSIVESIDLISRARRDLEQFYLILDGLDEAGQVGRELVESLFTIKPPLRILVSTRPRPDILEALQNCVFLDSHPSVTLSGHLEYTSKLLKEDSRISGYFNHDHDNIAKAAKMITYQSQGSFIYTNAMVKSLVQAETQAAFKQLMYDPPSSIVGIYTLMLDNVFHQPVEIAALARKTLRIILQTDGPMSDQS
ncbi:hypothetical protein N7519_007966 [Penicillium mononematosum]|uniref:uncharacterized protein n=1 Tax=Penicillium mononematosum TaxID=268346 RepID=UPI0025491A5E|nr:uncharacterized protein N7519_007966 [Penicillium mononematosum]KAJ6186665.1 hypothetical protein N7519_007966 [Penicillium mononematosum]